MQFKGRIPSKVRGRRLFLWVKRSFEDRSEFLTQRFGRHHRQTAIHVSQFRGLHQRPQRLVVVHAWPLTQATQYAQMELDSRDGVAEPVGHEDTLRSEEHTS